MRLVLHRPSIDRHHTTRIFVAATLAAALLPGCGSNKSQQLDDTAINGKQTAARLGCNACHSTNGSTSIGPTWKDGWGTTVTLDDGTEVKFDNDYVTRSVRDPTAQRRPGDWIRMPTFSPDQLSDDELAEIIAYLTALSDQ